MSTNTTGVRRAQVIGATLLVVALAALLLVFRAGPTPVAGSTYTTNDSTVYQDFGGTVRNTGSGWYVLDDAGHTPDDITIGTVTSTYVQVHYPECAEITSAIVAPDDTYARVYGASFGASVGLSYLLIYGSINDSSDSGTAADTWDPTTDYSASSNIWITGRCIPE
ncbi:hypothetical protein [Glycomyces tenuis]|uniref:hypothetical protein n=1 Tax=Glycomyces tenuis TaxID=58116 RepID=UPI000425E883|nr:hypothetical protein [Glycomyces tenuis]